MSTQLPEQRFTKQITVPVENSVLTAADHVNALKKAVNTAMIYGGAAEAHLEEAVSSLAFVSYHLREILREDRNAASINDLGDLAVSSIIDIALAALGWGRFYITNNLLISATANLFALQTAGGLSERQNREALISIAEGYMTTADTMRGRLNVSTAYCSASEFYAAAADLFSGRERADLVRQAIRCCNSQLVEEGRVDKPGCGIMSHTWQDTLERKNMLEKMLR